MVKSVCGYCGVGCGVEFDSHKLIGNKEYPVNNGSLCQKGASSLQSVKMSNRLLNPQVREHINQEFCDASWQESIKIIANKIKSTPKHKVAFYLSGQMLSEDYYVANKLGKGFIGTNNVDTNSRTCMSSAVVAYKKSIGADFVPLRSNDIFLADLLILAGSNCAESHVILHNKIKKAQKNGLKVVVIDPRYTETAKIADIYICIKVGGDIDFFNLISKRLIENDLYDKEFVGLYINGFENLKNSLAKLNEDDMLHRIGISYDQFEEFFSLYRGSQNIITAWTMGLNQSSQGVDKNLSLINTHLLSGKIFKRGNGPLSLTGQPNAMGGREVGGLSTMLAVHLGFDKQSIDKVAAFWNTQNISPKAGLCATQMMEADIDVLVICHTDPVYHLPNRNKTEAAMRKIPLIVEINAYQDSQTSKFAHIRLPAAPWGEKEGTQTNLERTITKQEKLFEAPRDVKADWEIFCLLAHELGYETEFNYKSTKDIFQEYQEMTKLNPYMDIAKASYDDLSKQPFIWGENIKEFLTPDKKGNLFFVENMQYSQKTTKQYPFILLTGRTRDQWHSGTKSSHVESLLKYKSIDFCEINTDDAKKLNIQNGQNIKIVSKYGEIIAKAFVTDHISEKNLFVPISHKDINYLTNDILDKESLQPDYNHTAVQIVKII